MTTVLIIVFFPPLALGGIRAERFRRDPKVVRAFEASPVPMSNLAVGFRWTIVGSYYDFISITFAVDRLAV